MFDNDKNILFLDIDIESEYPRMRMKPTYKWNVLVFM